MRKKADTNPADGFVGHDSSRVKGQVRMQYVIKA